MIFDWKEKLWALVTSPLTAFNARDDQCWQEEGRMTLTSAYSLTVQTEPIETLFSMQSLDLLRAVT